MTAKRGSGDNNGVSTGRLGSLWESLISSFWFIPAVITTGAVVLFFVTQYLDQLIQTNLAYLPIVFAGGAQAARSVLSAIAGSLITVVATVFSLTVVTLQLASSSYTPRIMRSFTSDHGVQVVLGAYVATFLYSLLVLRVIRTPESEGASFNPVISVTVAVVLAVLCVALLIYFIAHIVNLIQASTIVGRAHDDVIKAVAGLDDLEDAPAEPRALEGRPELGSVLAGKPLVVRAKESGYVQYLNVEAVVDAVNDGSGAFEEDRTTVVEIPFGPGLFVASGLPIVLVWPARELGSEEEEKVYEAFYFGKDRSFRQDFALGLRQLSDIALKGLSPGVNDPTTAMQAMDRMEAIFIALGSKALPQRTRHEERGNGEEVLVKVGYYGFDNVVGLAFDQIRRAAFTSGQVAVLERLLEVIERALAANDIPERQKALWERASAVGRLAPSQVSASLDAVALACRTVEVGASLLKTELGAAVGSDLESLADLSEALQDGERVREAVDAAWRRHG